jgi:DNA-binding GntR family transcriptional regulator
MRLVYDAEGTPIEHTESRYPPTRYVLDIELHAD